jgi:hypothetical protein
MHNRHLMWASESVLPDLGGAECDDFTAWSDALSEPIVNSPGVYRTVCVELEVLVLINTVFDLVSIFISLKDIRFGYLFYFVFWSSGYGYNSRCWKK